MNTINILDINTTMKKIRIINNAMISIYINISSNITIIIFVTIHNVIGFVVVVIIITAIITTTATINIGICDDKKTTPNFGFM